MVVGNANDSDFIDFNSYESMAELSEQDFLPRRYQRGEVVSGEVVRIDDDGIVVSIGLKTEGMVPPQEMRTLSPEERENLQPGDSLIVTVRSMRGPGDMAQLSIDQAASQRGWVELRQSLDSGEPVTARIVEQNKGGIVVHFHGIRGFVPFSQMAPLSGGTREEVLAERIGQDAPFNVLEIDQRRERLVMTERPLWQKQQDAEREQFLSQLEIGSRVTGKVTSLRGFGAFVSLGQAEGLVHISELAWGPHQRPRGSSAGRPGNRGTGHQSGPGKQAHQPQPETHPAGAVGNGAGTLQCGANRRGRRDPHHRLWRFCPPGGLGRGLGAYLRTLQPPGQRPQRMRPPEPADPGADSRH